MHCELKNVKIAEFLSEETVAFTASLYIDGKRAADVKNDGQGGNNFAWFKDKELEKAFDAWCASLPPVTGMDDGEPYSLDMNDDLWFSKEIERIQDERYWKRKCSKSICIRLKKHAEDEFAQYKGGWYYTPERAAKLRDQFGTDLVEIINERFL